jgi:hypothetical protein
MFIRRQIRIQLLQTIRLYPLPVAYITLLDILNTLK